MAVTSEERRTLTDIAGALAEEIGNLPPESRWRPTVERMARLFASFADPKDVGAARRKYRREAKKKSGADLRLVKGGE